jgi:hypothetical protein
MVPLNLSLRDGRSEGGGRDRKDIYLINGMPIWRGRGLARYDVGLQKAKDQGLLTGDGMKSFWRGNPNVEGSNPSGPTKNPHSKYYRMNQICLVGEGGGPRSEAIAANLMGSRGLGEI